MPYMPYGEYYALEKQSQARDIVNDKKFARIEKRQVKLYEMTRQNRPRFIRFLYRLIFC